MQQSRIVFDQHMHTPLCNHARGYPREYAEVAEARGLRGITVSCHCPTPREWWHCMKLEEWPQYLAMIEEARQEFAGRVEVYPGIECDYMPELEAWLASFLPDQPLHHVLGSVHPQVRDYQVAYDTGSPFELQQTYYRHLAQAAETGLFDTLSHPDLVKIVYPDEWQVERLLPDITAALDRIAATGVAMELNTSGLLKVIPEMNPAPEILRAMAQRGIPVVVGSDAHTAARVADHFEEAYDLLEQAGYQQVRCFVERRPIDLSLAEARSSLRSLPAAV